MNNSKKTTAFVISALVLLIGVLVLLLALPEKKKPEKVATTISPTATPAPTNTPTTAPTEQEPPKTPSEDTEEEIPAPIFSLEDSFYDKDMVLEITDAANKPGFIHYTLDGSEPTKASTLYTKEGIVLKEGDKQLVKEMESFYKYPHEESWDLNGYIVKARVFYDDGSVSPTAVHTYLINKNIAKRYENYVLCISGDFNDLTNNSTGILAGGSNKRGKESEVTAHAELLTSDGSMIFSQYIGMRPYGGASRGAAVKSFKMYARKDAGSNKGKFTLPGELFNTKCSDGSLMEKYDRLVVRAGGNDLCFGFLRDEMNQGLMRESGFATTEGTVPVVVYINGNYYGLLWLHENYCNDYFKELFKNETATGKFITLEGGDGFKNESDDVNDIEKAALEDYNSFYKDLAYSDLTNDAKYEELLKHIDVENYLDYFAFNIYLANNDWPQNNYKCYRYMPGENEALGEGVYDGRWRYLPHDMDFAQYLYHNDDKPHETEKTTGAKCNTVKLICDPKSNRHAPLFAKLMEREDCREYFINQIITLGNTVLTKDNVSSAMKEIVKKQKKELERFLPLIRKNSRNEWWPSVDSVNQNYTLIERFHKERLDYLLTYFEEEYGYVRK